VTFDWPGPRGSVEALVGRLGADGFVRACVDLLAGREVEAATVYALGGPPARWAVDGSASGPDYWLRVWALRGLLWHWGEAATAPTVQALTDDAWRVREMAAKVVARHRVDEALEQVLVLRRDDPVPRVRSAASRAVDRVTGH
jgi:HEAT repeat protein